ELGILGLGDIARPTALLLHAAIDVQLGQGGVGAGYGNILARAGNAGTEDQPGTRLRIGGVTHDVGGHALVLELGVDRIANLYQGSTFGDVHDEVVTAAETDGQRTCIESTAG